MSEFRKNANKIFTNRAKEEVAQSLKDETTEKTAQVSDVEQINSIDENKVDDVNRSDEEAAQQIELNNELPAIKSATDSEYLNRCHNYVYHVQATFYLIKAGLYSRIDELQIGYDVERKELTIPIDDTQYYSIDLADKQTIVKSKLENVIQQLEGKVKTSKTDNSNDYMDFGQLEVTGIVTSRGKDFFLMTTKDYELIRVIVENNSFKPLEELKQGDKVICKGTMTKKFSKKLNASTVTKEQ